MPEMQYINISDLGSINTSSNGYKVVVQAGEVAKLLDVGKIIPREDISGTIESNVNNLNLVLTEGSDYIKIASFSKLVEYLRPIFLKSMYTVGELLFSTTLSTAAAVEAIYGGTWEAYAEGRMIAGVGQHTDKNGTTYSFSVNTSNGGTQLGEYVHTLAMGEMPLHNHNVLNSSSSSATINTTTTGNHRHAIISSSSDSEGAYNDWGKNSSRTNYSGYAGDHYHQITLRSAGGNGAHNNVPPFNAVYIWRRIA